MKPLLPPKQLQWACRRGMLELDVLLMNFLSSGYNALPDTQKHIFQSLLTYPDPQLFDWFLGYSHPDDAALSEMVQKIREHKRQPLSS